ncbi:MAG TPA: peptidoglycan recognition family protein [Candidatus Acidoferrales bacterium]|jgi:hypothetical protein|nr:peptidoglycan recognition family protein [Candidatus Acidoferrales bacterium]
METKPLVEWTARQIRDPLLRLRFLQATAPRIVRPARPKPYQRAYLAAATAILFPVVVFFAQPARGSHQTNRNQADMVLPAPTAAPVRVPANPEIWLVETTEDAEAYSNGLRVETRFAVATRPRSFRAFPVAHPEDTLGEPRSQPAGIVFHTTESVQAPFEPRQNTVLKQISESLLDYVRRRRAYNFLIDRFGRVYRVVVESDAADHAGHSVWRDEQWFYVNLNESFLGVSFETETLPGQVEAAISPAQLHSAAMLTEMLRSRYGIPAANCVTHAQVSVNPSNMRIGYHTDWASSFPFEQVGLPDNYDQPLPALLAFGFAYDSSFVSQTGGRMYRGVQLAEHLLQAQAAAAHLQLPAYRQTLQKRYWLQVNIRNQTFHQTFEEAQIPTP